MRNHPGKKVTMNALRVLIEPVFGGWSVRLSDGQLLARFRGPWARYRAERFIAAYVG
jgi:hypothetical protein